MAELQDISAEDVKLLMEAEYCAAAYIPLQHALAPFLVQPFLRMLVWPYAAHRVEYPCWIIADLGSQRPRLTLGYSAYGHGRDGAPWGIVPADQQWYGGDDSWFACLEDAFIKSGAWPKPLPPEYEIRGPAGD